MTEALLAWFDHHQRELPWRRPQDRADPYRVLVAEVMLQQTRVDTVVPYYQAWLERFPTVAALASATEDEVLLAWEGLGYYRRARNLRAAAKAIVELHGGAVPTDRDALRALPGIGRYTSAALMATAFGQAIVAVDGNVRRVAARLSGSRQRVSELQAERDLAPLACGPRAAQVGEALIELGALLCTPLSPACDRCPLRPVCVAARTPDPGAFPATPPRSAVPVRRYWALVALTHSTPCEPGAAGPGLGRSDVTEARPDAELGASPASHVWLHKRPSEGLLGGMWGFPQTERRPPASPLPGSQALPLVQHAYSHFRLELQPLLVGPATLVSWAPDAVAVPLERLATLPLSTVDRLVLQRLRAAGVIPRAPAEDEAP